MRTLVFFVLTWLTSSVLAEDVKLSQYQTEYQFRGDQASRAHNVELAAQKVNLVELYPGDTFSFNKVVGERSEANGYQLAHTILQQKLVDDWGGGACQVASTLHAAALTAGLEIRESHAHSLASAYMQPAMDSAIHWPDLDFKFRNNTQRVVRIEITTKEVTVKKIRKRVLIAALYSDRDPNRGVTVSFKTLKTLKKPTWRIKSDKVKRGSFVDQKGKDGYVVERTLRVVDKATGEVYVDQVRKYSFKPLPRIVWVAR